MRLSELISRVYVNSVENIEQDNLDTVNIKGVAQDTRKLKQGYLFVCIEGYTVDGHDFTDQAIEEGAVAIVAEKPVQAEVPVLYVKDTKRYCLSWLMRFLNIPAKVCAFMV